MNTKKYFAQYADLYKHSLYNDIMPFWEKYSLDKQYGGYFSCLDAMGNVYDTDKFVWLQGRQTWLFSMLYQEVEAKESWLQIANHGYQFLKKHAQAENGHCYFSLDQTGRPLIHPYNIFSDCFVALAFGKYGKAAGDEEAMELARNLFLQVIDRQDNPKGQWEKSTGNRPLKGFALPMILSNLVLELEPVLDTQLVEKLLDTCIHEVMEVFYDPEYEMIFEYVAPDGSHVDSFEGRLINPGHGLEAMWFLMDIAQRRKDEALMKKAIRISLELLDFGWDEAYGGIYYFLDSQGAPPLQLEWDQKLWWVHLEALLALAKGYLHHPSEEIWNWYQKVHTYTWTHFPDPEHGEWWGYLNRRGEPFLRLKGGKWKGCFHVPRAMYQGGKVFEQIQKSHSIP